MRNSLFFAVFFVFGFVGVVNAFPTDSNTYPNYASGKPTTAAELTVKDANVRVATTKYVDTQAANLESPINTLASTATTDNTAVTTNGNAIGAPASGNTAATGLFANKIDAPSGSGNTCPSGQVCGYISADGAGGTKKWVVIQGAP
ncbi:MAG: hypothetical protein IKL95_01810 [Alphaproteobacteria bacterium]|nr:hypothetical protein [Alphaproteobacteria bacterium]